MMATGISNSTIASINDNRDTVVSVIVQKDGSGGTVDSTRSLPVSSSVFSKKSTEIITDVGYDSTSNDKGENPEMNPSTSSPVSTVVAVPTPVPTTNALLPSDFLMSIPQQVTLLSALCTVQQAHTQPRRYMVTFHYRHYFLNSSSTQSLRNAAGFPVRRIRMPIIRMTSVDTPSLSTITTETNPTSGTTIDELLPSSSSSATNTSVSSTVVSEETTIILPSDIQRIGSSHSMGGTKPDTSSSSSIGNRNTNSTHDSTTDNTKNKNDPFLPPSSSVSSPSFTTLMLVPARGPPDNVLYIRLVEDAHSAAYPSISQAQWSMNVEQIVSAFKRFLSFSQRSSGNGSRHSHTSSVPSSISSNEDHNENELKKKIIDSIIKLTETAEGSNSSNSNNSSSGSATTSLYASTWSNNDYHPDSSKPNTTNSSNDGTITTNGSKNVLSTISVVTNGPESRSNNNNNQSKYRTHNNQNNFSFPNNATKMQAMEPATDTNHSTLESGFGAMDIRTPRSPTANTTTNNHFRSSERYTHHNGNHHGRTARRQNSNNYNPANSNHQRSYGNPPPSENSIYYIQAPPTIITTSPASQQQPYVSYVNTNGTTYVSRSPPLIISPSNTPGAFGTEEAGNRTDTTNQPSEYVASSHDNDDKYRPAPVTTVTTAMKMSPKGTLSSNAALYSPPVIVSASSVAPSVPTTVPYVPASVGPQYITTSIGAPSYVYPTVTSVGPTYTVADPNTVTYATGPVYQYNAPLPSYIPGNSPYVVVNPQPSASMIHDPQHSYYPNTVPTIYVNYNNSNPTETYATQTVSSPRYYTSNYYDYNGTSMNQAYYGTVSSIDTRSPTSAASMIVQATPQMVYNNPNISMNNGNGEVIHTNQSTNSEQTNSAN